MTARLPGNRGCTPSRARKNSAKHSVALRSPHIFPRSRGIRAHTAIRLRTSSEKMRRHLDGDTRRTDFLIPPIALPAAPVELRMSVRRRCRRAVLREPDPLSPHLSRRKTEPRPLAKMPSVERCEATNVPRHGNCRCSIHLNSGFTGHQLSNHYRAIN